MKFGTANVSISHPSSPRFRRMTAAALTSCVGLLAGITSAGDVESPMQIAEPTKQLTTATVYTDRGTAHFYVSSNVIIRTVDIESVRAFITKFPNVTIGKAMGKDKDVFAVHTENVSSALRILEELQSLDSVSSATLDKKQFDPNYENSLQKFRQNAAKHTQNRAVGIELLNDTQSSRGGSDPLVGSQWHLTNTAGTFAGNDNNITSDIYDVQGITGAGVTVAISTGRLNTHIDTDHTDILTNYSPVLSMQFDPDLLGDSTALTGNAGIISAERGNGIAGQGVAPGSKVATIYWGGSTTPLHESQAYDWMLNDVAIKAFRPTIEYLSSRGAYNAAGDLDYVTDSFQNSIRFGRRSKGVINIFGTGFNTLDSFSATGRSPLPNPYEFTAGVDGTFSPIDQMQAAGGNVFTDGVTFGYLEGPYFFNGQTNNYPPASDRRAIVINSVSQDGSYDSTSALGTNIFASVYGGTSNIFYADDNGDTGDAGTGVVTIAPGGGSSGALPDDASEGASSTATQTGASIAAGIVALMLDANPNLSARDVQHILFNSIQESTRAPSVKWPNFTTSRQYYIPNSITPMGFWQVNSGLYNSDTVTNQAIRHSDQYGFGMIDAELAVTMASTYGKSPKLFLLDTGEVIEDDFRLPRDVPDNEFDVLVDADGSTGAPGSAVFNALPGPDITICVRQNIRMEAVVLELTVEGDGNNDLWVELTSPTGTRSILKIPSTGNTFFGTADDENPFDDDFDNIGLNDNGFAFISHPFLTWKHWGEFSGGEWSFNVLDYGSDEAAPMGEDPGTGTMPDPGADMFVALGEIGVPGNPARTDKTITGFRFKIYGSQTDLPIFLGCAPFETSCPGDIDGNGIVNLLDLQIYLSWFINGNSFADIDGDGVVDFLDLLAYRGIWTPGFCTTGATPFVGGRPHPGQNNQNGSDNNPIIRPI